MLVVSWIERMHLSGVVKRKMPDVSRELWRGKL
jgi:hypothetical protein